MGEEEEEMQEAEEAGARKRKRGGVGVGGEEEVGGDGDGVCDKDLLLGDDYCDDDDGARYEGIAEEAVAEVMRWLEAEIASPAPAACSSPTTGFAFVTINGNEESCGPSFSAAASTVMASVDTRAGAPPPPPLPWPWPEHPLQRAADMDADAGDDAAADGTRRKEDAAVEMVVGSGDADEEWLARLLTCCGPLLEGVL